jgi:hypothetical protein
LITIGALAKHYGLLPSDVAARATTFDLMVYDVSMTWEQHQQDKAEGKSPMPQLSEEELLKLVRKPQSGQ